MARSRRTAQPVAQRYHHEPYGWRYHRRSRGGEVLVCHAGAPPPMSGLTSLPIPCAVSAMPTTFQINPPSKFLHPGQRDMVCALALDDHFQELAREAVAVGWKPEEVASAAIWWAVHCTSEQGGPEAVRRLLAEVTKAIEQPAQPPT